MRALFQPTTGSPPPGRRIWQWMTIYGALLAGLWLSGCDNTSDSTVSNKGNVSVSGNEGRLVGHGRMVVGQDTVEVRGSRVFVNGTDYGPVNENAEVYFRTNGSYRLLTVNGEGRNPVSR